MDELNKELKEKEEALKEAFLKDRTLENFGRYLAELWKFHNYIKLEIPDMSDEETAFFNQWLIDHNWLQVGEGFAEKFLADNINFPMQHNILRLPSGSLGGYYGDASPWFSWGL